ncbi:MULTISPECIES: xanthine dehydrogenase family protein molybdopterin-binding subunit [unclassified Amycolatopsis]|uniref:xanthine dehydrogenase family protein molybdopterin-binding subunit n=1 Tax=unclassified Amycolatopsis TaxID=2618356 RepID=UPI0028750063|nr:MULTISPECIES: xanthine dehydrogenase family protein molybdopterin-binding subunit [unclassified Amycolatopsis]MDS0138787.1 xanthine dehydrogenase family protein molybdopterin-binding subunit [Amycolatopsis sp. 505]MDS0147281.1 xanthine dehydrogenase family protein molybdopterin-binding subunit [Amycolatopsis sp. CM201R]
MTPRADAVEKVTGRAAYGTDRVPDGLAHAALVPARIGRGRVSRVDTAAAEAVPGVLLVVTRFDEEELRGPGFIMGGGFSFQSLQPLLDDRVAYRGQPIALVVAETPVAATEAAELVTADYAPEPVAVHLDAEGATTLVQEEAIPLPFLADIKVGDADAVIDASPVRIDRTYEHAAQHAVPMELNGAVVEWRGGTLVVHEGTQNAAAVRHGLAQQLGLDPACVEVRSPYVGGGFGQKNSLQPHLAPLALVARRLGRPVKLVLTRTQTFHNGSFRPATRHRVRLGADETGRILGAVHEVDQQTSRHDLFPAMHTEVTSRLYGFGAFRGRHRLVQTDVQTPGYMRAPFESSAMFAFESAVDELAYATGQDPVALRLANDTLTDPVSGRPFSTRFLAECLRRGAEDFGWAARDPRPGSMRAGDGSLIGWGVAAGAYPGHIAPAVAHLTAHADGRVTVGVDGHEMGQGIRSAIALLVANDLGIAVRDVEVRVGDTRYAPQHLTAGSWGTATALPAVHSGLRELRKHLDAAGTGPVDVAAAVTRIGHPVEVEATTIAPGQPPEAAGQAKSGHLAIAGPVYPEFSTFSWVAHFVEVRVEPMTCRIRVPRVVSVVDCGRVASPVTAASQVRGGVIWGIGGALREESLPDPHSGGFLNATLEEYPVMVNADVHRIDVGFVDEPDLRFNPVGVKGLGEVAMVGVAAAVANAVHHATGKRHHRLPIRLDDVL